MTPILIACCGLLAGVAVTLAWALGRCRSRLHTQTETLRRELKESRLSLLAGRDAMLNALNDAFLLVDHEAFIRFANAPARDLFRGRELLNRRLGEVFLDERLAMPVREALESRRNVRREVILPQQASPLGTDDRRGETAWIVDAGPMVGDRAAHVTRVIIRDTTTEHQTEQIRKDFVANASHELRTPLAIINGYIENLLDDDLVSDETAARRFLGIMQKHGERIARIVEDMLVISRLESGEAAGLNLEPFEFEACVRDILERLESVISSQGAKIKLRMPPTGLTLVGDRFYWTQVLFNLVENSLKQNPRIPLKIEIGAKISSDGVPRIWVSDNGVGIPSADLPFIFRRFYRVEKHHSQGEVKGTGLGLSIVRRAVEAHRGRIEVTSTPGQATRFEIHLPPDAISPPPDDPPPEATPADRLSNTPSA